MSCGTKSSMLLPQMVFSASSVTVSIFAAGSWEPTGSENLGRGWGELRNKTGNLQVQVAWQFTNDLQTPGSTYTAVGPLQTADGVGDPTAWITIAQGAYKYRRPVWLVSLSSASAIAFGQVTGVIQVGAT